MDGEKVANQLGHSDRKVNVVLKEDLEMVGKAIRDLYLHGFSNRRRQPFARRRDIIRGYCCT